MPHSPAKPPVVRWFICALLFFATTINYVDRQILALLQPVLEKKFHWSNTDYGNIAAAFQGAYAVGLLAFGWLVDRFGAKVGYGLSIFAWSLAAMGHAFVSTVSGFTGVRVALGLSEGGNFPSAVKAVVQWFPKAERALATSIFNAGTNVGAIAAPAVVPLLAIQFGWQAPFVAAGIAGIGWLFLWVPFFSTPEKSRFLGEAEFRHIHGDADTDEAESDRDGGVAWRELLRHRQAWSFVVAKFMTDPVWYFMLAWLPAYFAKTRGLDLKSVGLPLVTIYAIITVLSIAGGWLSGFLLRRGWSVTRARKTSMITFALCVVPLATIGSVGNGLAVLMLGLAGAAHQAWSATLYTTVSDMFPKRAVASLIGIGGMMGSVGGIIIQKAAGPLLDHQGAAAGFGLLFGFCSLSYLACFFIHHGLAPSFEPVKMTEKPA